jgi:hypothetical protein
MFEFTEPSLDTANLDMCCELIGLIDFWGSLTPAAWVDLELVVVKIKLSS